MRIGVDEAGKGPALGSMFAGAVRAPIDALPGGLDDSKRLSPGRREVLARALREDERIDVAVVEVPVGRIDDPGTDMNGLTVAAHADALASLAADGDRAILDAGDVDATRFARRVAARVDAPHEVIGEHGADERYPIVSAASVVAKVERDAHVAALADEYGDLGSGYPSDPTTRAFLREFVATHGDLPACARSSWATCEDVLAAASRRSLEEF